MLKFVIPQALPTRIGRVMPMILSIALLGFLGVASFTAAKAQDGSIVVIVEDIQGRMKHPDMQLQIPQKMDTSYELTIYVGDPPSSTEQLIEIERLEVFDQGGQLVYSGSFYSNIVEIPVSSLGTGIFEFHVYSGVGLMSGSLNL